MKNYLESIENRRYAVRGFFGLLVSSSNCFSSSAADFFDLVTLFCALVAFLLEMISSDNEATFC